MLVERFQYEDTFRDNRGQHHQSQIPAVAGFHELRGDFRVRRMVLDKMPDNQVRIDEASLAHWRRSRIRAVATLPTCEKESPLPFELASRPFKDLIPG